MEKLDNFSSPEKSERSKLLEEFIIEDYEGITEIVIVEESENQLKFQLLEGEGGDKEAASEETHLDVLNGLLQSDLFPNDEYEGEIVGGAFTALNIIIRKK